MSQTPHTSVTHTEAQVAELSRLDRAVAEAKKARLEYVATLAPVAVQDYELQTLSGTVRLSSLFGAQRDLIVIHNMGRSCAYCTLWADGLQSLVKPIESRAAIVLVSPDEPSVQAEFAKSRGWVMRMASSRGSTFSRDMGFEPEPGRHWPGASAFAKLDDGSIVRCPGFAQFGIGDDFCAVWPLMDLLTDGPRGWGPRFVY